MSTREPKLIRRKLRHESNFTQVPNTWLRDAMLSYRARGILSLLLSHEDGWTITLKNLAEDSPKEGIDAVRVAVVELEDRGYLVRHVVQGQGGRFLGDDWELRDPHDTGAATLPALDNPTRRKRTALDKTTRSALDNPTPIRTPVRTSKKSSKGEYRSEHYSNGGRLCTAELIDERHCALGHLIALEEQAVTS